MSPPPRPRFPVTRLLLAASPVRRMLGYWARALRRRGGKGGWARYYYYPAGQPGPGEPDDQWEPEPGYQRRRVSPPDDAYERVTNPERFQPLHSAAMEMISRMEETFDVHRVEGHGLDEELEGKRAIERPSVRLTPVNSNAAPVTVAFSDFPGLFVRVGRWVIDDFPSCGCDACHESAEGEIERLTELVDAVTAEGFREAVQCPKGPLAGDGCLKFEFRTPTYRRRSSGSRIRRSRALQMSGGARHLKLHWQPWPRRQPPAGR